MAAIDPFLPHYRPPQTYDSAALGNFDSSIGRRYARSSRRQSSESSRDSAEVPLLSALPQEQTMLRTQSSSLLQVREEGVNNRISQQERISSEDFRNDWENREIEMPNWARLPILRGVDTATESHYPMSTEAVSEVPMIPIIPRHIRVAAILFRPETVKLLQAIEQQNLTPLFASYEHLHTLADLISEDLITVENGSLRTTPFAERSIESFVRDNEGADAAQ